MGKYNNNVTAKLINVCVFFDDKIPVYFPIYCFIVLLFVCLFVCLFDGI